MKKTPELLDRAKRVGYAEAAMEVAESMQEYKELAAWLQSELDKEFSIDMNARAKRGEFRKLIVRDRFVKFR